MTTPSTSRPVAATVPQAFEKFEEALKLDRQEVVVARQRHNDVRDCLAETLFVRDSFLQGSFARKTMVSPLNDVDVVLLLPDADRDELKRPGGPEHSMERLKDPLRRCFPGIQFDLQKKADHALRLDFPDVDFHIDLVPSFDLYSDNGDIEIADRKLDTWEWSNSRELIRVVSDRNQHTSGRFVPQVRMVKTFATVTQGLDVCGLIAESITYNAVTSKVGDQTALLDSFRRGARLTSGGLTDPTGVDDLLKGWDFDRRQAAASIFSRAADLAQEAVDLEQAGDEAGAIATWGRLLGPQFPMPEGGSEPQQVFKDWFSGGKTSGNRVTPAVGAAGLPVRTTRSHRQQ